MLSHSKMHLYRAPWYVFFPGVFLTVLVLSLKILADTFQRILSAGKLQ